LPDTGLAFAPPSPSARPTSPSAFGPSARTGRLGADVVPVAAKAMAPATRPSAVAVATARIHIVFTEPSSIRDHPGDGTAARTG
jgi:hypothetical protein